MAKIYIAFRFHGNFYHSYRGDTPDELGFGTDIRIIRHILRVLDGYNRRGIPVRGTWDFENYFSLEKIMPEHCPDIIEGLQRRVRAGTDEMQLMSYNNGFINAHTAREFEEAIGRAITNPAGSGVRDLFAEGYFNMVRPQEMMFTPIHLKLYRACGVDSISLYYSALPFNGFSNFIPQLSLRESYNPLTLTYPGIEETMTLLPCYNMGDLADHLTLRRWVRKLRKEQLAMVNPCDLLLVLDQDADDPTWYGFDIPGFIKSRFSTARGLEGMVEDVLDLDYVRFTTPGRYLSDHAPVGTVCFGQDTADGNFDGLSSWAEKWSNHELFTGLERARILELQTRRLMGDAMGEQIARLLEESFELRVKLLSTTHFGMAAPVMNVTRERTARALVRRAVEAAEAAFDLAAKDEEQSLDDEGDCHAPAGLAMTGDAVGDCHAPAGLAMTKLARAFGLVDYVRGVSTDQVQYHAHASRALVRLPVKEPARGPLEIRNGEGEVVPSVLLQTGDQSELLFVERFAPGEEKRYTIETGHETRPAEHPVLVTGTTLQNELLLLELDQRGHITSFKAGGHEYSGGRLLDSSVDYGGKLYRVERWETVESQDLGLVGVKRMRGEFLLKRGYPVRYEREILLAAGLPYVYVTLRATYPRTPDRGYSRGTAKRLEQAWDNAWKAVHPCEISPRLDGNPAAGSTVSRLKVWKHNFCNHVSTFGLDTSSFTPNRELASINNQVTSGWVAVSDGERGLLVAQDADVCSSVAFCPVRTVRQGDALQVKLNPFGTYTGPHYRYGTADTGLGTFIAATLSAASHIRPYAPSYNGQVQEMRLMLAPYEGDAPPESLQHDAEAFAYPYAVV